MRSPRGLFANLLLSLASVATVALVLVAAELLMRRASPGYLEHINLGDLAYLHTYSPELGWTPRPSFRYTLAGSETTINRLGYRGREYGPEHGSGKTRIVMLGDSITFGFGVRDDETFSADLERLDPALEVVNLGVQGYGTDQELLKLRGEGLAYRPDGVVLNVCLANDPLDNAADKSIYDGVYPKPYFRLVDGRLVEFADHVRLSPSRRLAFWLSQRSVLFNWVLDATHVDRARYQRELAGESASEAGEKAFEVTFALVRAVHDEATAHRAWFVAFLYPSLRDFIRPSSRAARFLRSPELQGVDVVDLLPRFVEAGFTRETFSRYALDGNLHLTREGHQLAARIILDVLREKGRLDAAAGSPVPRGPAAPSSPSAP